MIPHDHTGEEACFTAIIDGLTYRELIAAACLSECIRTVYADVPFADSNVPTVMRVAAVHAVLAADALITELAKDKS